VFTQAQIDEHRHAPIPAQNLLIGEQWEQGQDDCRIDVLSPIDGQRLTTIAEASQADVERAVQVARKTFDSGVWSRMRPAERKRIMRRIGDLIEANALELAVLGVRDNGTEIAFAINAEPLGAANTFRFYGEAIDKVNGDITPTPDGSLGMIMREPIGVVGAIVPWNMPLMIGAWKIAPALAMGNSVVLKPSREASLALLRVAELCLEAGLPPGVLNVVTGGGQTGEALGMSMDVDVLVFTGSGPTGRRLLEYSARSNLKRVYMELGGKSPHIVFDDVPSLDQAADAAVSAIFRNSGQVCVAGARLLVHRRIADDLMERILARTAALTVGDPLNLNTDVGAIISERQLAAHMDHVRRAREQGNTLLAGGQKIDRDGGGWYMQPTIFGNVDPKSDLAREEVFGPVLAVLPFDTEQEAIELANATEFGLASGLWTGSLQRAHRLAAAIKAGVVQINSYGRADITVPLSGHRQSGNSFDRSVHALDKYTNLKTVWLQYEDALV
jgi:4-(gamma-glutamylamino)butanal dehydrogenase